MCQPIKTQGTTEQVDNNLLLKIKTNDVRVTLEQNASLKQLLGYKISKNVKILNPQLADNDGWWSSWLMMKIDDGDGWRWWQMMMMVDTDDGLIMMIDGDEWWWRMLMMKNYAGWWLKDGDEEWWR